MFQKSEPLSQFQERIKCVLTLRNFDDIVSLRNAVVHPKPLVSGVFPLIRLTQVHRPVKDLISECKGETTYNMRELTFGTVDYHTIALEERTITTKIDRSCRAPKEEIGALVGIPTRIYQ